MPMDTPTTNDSSNEPAESSNHSATTKTLEIAAFGKVASDLFDQWRTHQHDKWQREHRRFVWRMTFAMLITLAIFAISIALIFVKDETSTGISILTHVVALLAGTAIEQRPDD